MDYLHFFNLKTAPFDKQSSEYFGFESKSYKEAYARLGYIMQSGGIFYLSGEYGIGKSSLLSRFAQQLPPKVNYVYIDYVKVQSYGILYQIANGLGLDASYSKVKLVCSLKNYFLKSTEKPLVIIDEAQDLINDALEDIRMLTSQDFDSGVPFILILSAHPSFSAKLKNHQALSQRINFAYQLIPFSPQETKAYLKHRMVAAGSTSYPFDPQAEELIFQYSNGIARKINKLATLSLIVAANAALHIIDQRVCESAIMEFSLNI